MKQLTIAVSDRRVLDGDAVRLKDIPAVGILLKTKRMADSANTDISKHNITRISHNIRPERRVVQIEVRDRASVETDSSKEDWPLDSLVGVKQIPPRLAVAVQGTASIDVDIFAAKFEEASRVLEVVLECVRLPELRVVGECYVALDVDVYV